MEKIEISTDYITLGQLLKMANLINTGGEAKFFLKENKVYVNDEFDNRRGRKLKDNDLIDINHQKFLIKKINGN